MDSLQEMIRKTKNPSIISFDCLTEQLPPALVQEEGSEAKAYGRFCRELLHGLRGTVPAVRFPFGTFAMLGAEGLTELESTLLEASGLGFYVLLDMPEFLSPTAAEQACVVLRKKDCPWRCDGVVISFYLGTDILKPFLRLCQDGVKDVFVVARTANKSAPEVQDLLTGSRLVHFAVADTVNRQGETMTGKYGYSRLAMVASAGAADSLRSLRNQYRYMFFLLDGYDYRFGSAKSASLGFDRLGRGAIACASTSVTGAWRDAEDQDYVAAAVEAAERMKRNLSKYVLVL